VEGRQQRAIAHDHGRKGVFGLVNGWFSGLSKDHVGRPAAETALASTDEMGADGDLAHGPLTMMGSWIGWSGGNGAPGQSNGASTAGTVDGRLSEAPGTVIGTANQLRQAADGGKSLRVRRATIPFKPMTRAEREGPEPLSGFPEEDEAEEGGIYAEPQVGRKGNAGVGADPFPDLDLINRLFEENVSEGSQAIGSHISPRDSPPSHEIVSKLSPTEIAELFEKELGAESASPGAMQKQTQCSPLRNGLDQAGVMAAFAAAEEEVGREIIGDSEPRSVAAAMTDEELIEEIRRAGQAVKAVEGKADGSRAGQARLARLEDPELRERETRLQEQEAALLLARRQAAAEEERVRVEEVRLAAAREQERLRRELAEEEARTRRQAEELEARRARLEGERRRLEDEEVRRRQEQHVAAQREAARQLDMQVDAERAEAARAEAARSLADQQRELEMQRQRQEVEKQALELEKQRLALEAERRSLATQPLPAPTAPSFHGSIRTASVADFSTPSMVPQYSQFHPSAAAPSGAPNDPIHQWLQESSAPVPRRNLDMPRPISQSDVLEWFDPRPPPPSTAAVSRRGSFELTNCSQDLFTVSLFRAQAGGRRSRQIPTRFSKQRDRRRDASCP
jgi:hypothetical protein